MERLTDAQLRMMQGIGKLGWAADLKSYLLSRTGATEEEWEALLKEKVVLLRAGRYVLTDTGRALYRNARQKRRYF